ncbi:MAG: hypothetical protein WDA03_10605 [Trueperaceae bacterium]
MTYRSARPLRTALTLLAAVLLGFPALLVLGVGSGVASAQSATESAALAATVRLTLGVAGHPVAEAWNPLRLELRDAPPATLSLQIDQGTLRSGAVPLNIDFEVRGGAGVSFFEELVFLPSFGALSWRLTTEERVLASGSVAGREADTRRLDLVLTSNPGAYRLAFLDTFGSSARLVDVAPALLPIDSGAYDGVRSLIIDGTSAAPRLEAVAAAASGGAIVALRGPLPASHAELALLLGGASTVRLGAGAIVYLEAERDQLVEAVSQVQVPSRQALQAALVQEPLVQAQAPLKETTLVMLVAAFAVMLLLLLRLGGAPGLLAALAFSGLVAVVGWNLTRPDAPRLQATAVLALGGSELATLQSTTELLTMPKTTLSLTQPARPLRPQAYWRDSAGTHFVLERWSSLLLEAPLALGDAHLRLEGGVPVNRGPRTLRDLYLVGEGLKGDLEPGSSTFQTSEERSADWARTLAPLVPEGTWLAIDDCESVCTTWVLYPDVQLASALPAAAEPPGGGGATIDPFRSAPTNAQDAP